MALGHGLTQQAVAALLHAAIERGDLDELDAFITTGGDVNVRFKGHSPLWCAAQYDNVKAVEMLLEAGADCNSWDGDETPLYRAISNNSVAALEALIQGGADLNATLTGESTPLTYAAELGSSDALDVLIRAGANTFGGDLNPLVVAIVSAQARCVSILIRANAALNIDDELEDAELYEDAFDGTAQERARAFSLVERTRRVGGWRSYVTEQRRVLARIMHRVRLMDDEQRRRRFDPPGDDSILLQIFNLPTGPAGRIFSYYTGLVLRPEKIPESFCEHALVTLPPDYRNPFPRVAQVPWHSYLQHVGTSGSRSAVFDRAFLRALGFQAA